METVSNLFTKAGSSTSTMLIIKS